MAELFEHDNNLESLSSSKVAAVGAVLSLHFTRTSDVTEGISTFSHFLQIERLTFGSLKDYHEERDNA